MAAGTPINWKNKKGITYIKVRYTTKKKGAIAKTKTLKSSGPFLNDPYPKTKYSNGNYGIETDASVKAKLAWYKRHYGNGKKTSGWYGDESQWWRNDRSDLWLAKYRKSRQKIVYVATKGMTNKVLFKVTNVQEGRIDEPENHRYFDQQKMPTVYGKYYFWSVGPQAVPVNWWNKKGVVYYKWSYYTKHQLKKMWRRMQRNSQVYKR